MQCRLEHYSRGYGEHVQLSHTGQRLTHAAALQRNSMGMALGRAYLGVIVQHRYYIAAHRRSCARCVKLNLYWKCPGVSRISSSCVPLQWQASHTCCALLGLQQTKQAIDNLRQWHLTQRALSLANPCV